MGRHQPRRRISNGCNAIMLTRFAASAEQTYVQTPVKILETTYKAVHATRHIVGTELQTHIKTNTLKTMPDFSIAAGN